MSWIAFGIYHNYTASTIDSDKSVLITPIKPRFDENVIKDIGARKVVQSDLSQPRPGVTTSPVPTATATTTQAAASESAGLPL